MSLNFERIRNGTYWRTSSDVWGLTDSNVRLATYSFGHVAGPSSWLRTMTTDHHAFIDGHLKYLEVEAFREGDSFVWFERLYPFDGQPLETELTVHSLDDLRTAVEGLYRDDGIDLSATVFECYRALVKSERLRTQRSCDHRFVATSPRCPKCSWIQPRIGQRWKMHYRNFEVLAVCSDEVVLKGADHNLRYLADYRWFDDAEFDGSTHFAVAPPPVRATDALLSQLDADED